MIGLGTRAVPLPALLVALVIGACGQGSSAPVSPVEGVVTDVDSEGLSEVRGFDLRLSDGTELTLTIGALENAAEVPPAHLIEHLASSEPVRAFFRSQDGEFVVYRLEVLHEEPPGG